MKRMIAAFVLSICFLCSALIYSDIRRASKTQFPTKKLRGLENVERNR